MAGDKPNLTPAQRRFLRNVISWPATRGQRYRPMKGKTHLTQDACIRKRVAKLDKHGYPVALYDPDKEEWL